MLIFFFNDTATTEIYTLSLHDALPIFFLCGEAPREFVPIWKGHTVAEFRVTTLGYRDQDRKSTRLNSSHSQISYAVFCLKKKKFEGSLLERPRRLPSTGPCWPCPIVYS